MQSQRLYGTLLPGIAVLVASCLSLSLASAQSCPHDDSGLKLPAGFCATVFADGIGHARHLVVAPNGVVYVNTWSGEYYDNKESHAGGFLVALQDKTGAGKADAIERFGETIQTGGAGGTGIGMYKESVYAEINDRIVRYSLPGGSIVPQAARPQPLSPNCLWVATIPCIHSLSMPRDPCSWMSPPPPIPVSRRTGNLKYPAPTLHRTRDPRRRLAL